MPIELLGSLMETQKQTAHGIVVIMDLKEAQNTLFDYVKTNVADGEEWISIWNGDPDGHRWPKQESFVMLCTPRSMFRRMLSAESSMDVQHRVYDELHDATAWQLFLLSHDLYEITQGVDRKIYLMTATTDTRIYTAVLKAVEHTLASLPSPAPSTRAGVRPGTDNPFGTPARSILKVSVPPAPGTQNPRKRLEEIPRALLPGNLEQLSWEKQTSHCRLRPSPSQCR